MANGGFIAAILKEYRESSMVELRNSKPFHERSYLSGKSSEKTFESAEKRERALRNKNMMGYAPGEIEALAYDR